MCPSAWGTPAYCPRSQSWCLFLLKVQKILKEEEEMGTQWQQRTLRGSWKPMARFILMMILRAAQFVSMPSGVRPWGHRRIVPITSAWTASWSGPR